MSYEKFSSELFTLETELDKKHRDRYQKMKALAQDFLSNQKEGMEMMTDITHGVYLILEKMAAD
jgi:peptide subunit release factor RF-3